MNMKTTKYLYVSKGKQYNKMGVRMTSTKGATHKNELCFKLNLEVPAEAFIDAIPQVTIEVPKDYKKKTIISTLGLVND